MPVPARKSRLNRALSETPAQNPIMVIEASLSFNGRQASWTRTARTGWRS